MLVAYNEKANNINQYGIATVSEFIHTLDILLNPSANCIVNDQLNFNSSMCWTVDAIFSNENNYSPYLKNPYNNTLKTKESDLNYYTGSYVWGLADNAYTIICGPDKIGATSKEKNCFSLGSYV